MSGIKRESEWGVIACQLPDGRWIIEEQHEKSYRNTFYITTLLLITFLLLTNYALVKLNQNG